MQLLTGLTGTPARMAFSPDGSLLAVGEEGRGTVAVWDVAGGSPDPLWAKWGTGLWNTFVFAPDGAALMAADYSGVRRRDARTGRIDDPPGLPGRTTTWFAPGGRYALSRLVAPRASVARLRCERLTSGGWEEVWARDHTAGARHRYAPQRVPPFSGDGERFALVSRFGRVEGNTLGAAVEVLATATGEVVSRWSGRLPSYLPNEFVSSTGAVVFIYLRALNAVDTSRPDSEPVKRLNATPKHFTSAAFSPDGSRLATASNDTAATIWDTATWEVRKRYEWNVGRLRAVCFAPDGLRCAAGGDDGHIVIWDLDD